MTKKTLLIAILISLLGCMAWAGENEAKDQGKPNPQRRPGQFQRMNKWSNKLKAAYEAEDMDKIGQLIEQMDEFKVKMHETRAGKKFHDGKGQEKGQRAEKAKKFNKRNRKKDRPAKFRHDDDMDGCHEDDIDQCRPRAWKRHHRPDQRNFRPDRKFAQNQYRPMRRRMWNYQQPWQQYGCQSDCQFGPRRFARKRGGYMNRGFASRRPGMRNQRQNWQGPQRRYQQQRFAGPTMKQGPMRHKQMRKPWQRQNQWQGPMAMQGQGKGGRRGQMARGFENRKQGQCPMYGDQRDFDRPYKQQWKDQQRKFKGPEMKRKWQRRQRQEMTPQGNEWEW